MAVQINKKTLIIYVIVFIAIIFALAITLEINSKDNSNSYTYSNKNVQPLNTSIINLEQIKQKDWNTFITEQKQLGVKTIVITHLRKQDPNTCEFRWINEVSNKEILQRINEINNKGLIVFLGSSSASEKCTNTTETLVNEAKYLRSELKYGLEDYNSTNIKGWYVEKSDSKVVAEIIKALTIGTNKKSVTIASMAGLNKDTKIQMIKDLKSYIEESGINYIYLKDSAGTDCNINSDLSSITDFYKEIVKVISKDKLGAIIDISSCGYNIQSNTAGFMRIKEQFIYAEKTGINTIAIENPDQYFSTNLSTSTTNSEYLFDAYSAYFLNNSTTKLLDKYIYTFSAPLLEKFQKRNGDELRNKHIPSPVKFDDRMWTGFEGNQNINIQLPNKQKIKWIAVTLESNLLEKITLPSQIKYTCEDNNNLLSKIDLQPSENRNPYEFTIINAIPINQKCQEIEINISNEKMTYIGEIEFIATK